MLLSHLVDALNPIRVSGRLDLPVDRVVGDSRLVRPGSVFVARRGLQEDGHEYIADAVSRGALAVVHEDRLHGFARIARVQVPDSRLAAATASSVLAGRPSSKLKVIGVAGTAGKTTVAFLIRSILERSGLRTGLVSSIHHRVGARVLPACRTTPEATDLQPLLAAMVTEGCQACVLEVSPQALAAGRVHAVDFDLLVHTRLGDFPMPVDGEPTHPTNRLHEAWWRSHLCGGGKALSVINLQDASHGLLLGQGAPRVHVTYGSGQEAMVESLGLELDGLGLRMQVRTPAGLIRCRSGLLGRTNAGNILAAVAAASAMGCPLSAIRQGILDCSTVPGRLEAVRVGQPFQVLVDYAHRPAALRETLGSLREVTPGRILLAVGCGGGVPVAERQEIGRVAAAMADFTLVTTDNPRREPAVGIARDVVDGFVGERVDGHGVEPDRREAIRRLVALAEPGDTVVIAGKGHETVQVFEDTVVPFDDRFFVREALQDQGYGKGNRVTRCGVQVLVNSAYGARSLQTAMLGA